MSKTIHADHAFFNAAESSSLGWGKYRIIEKSYDNDKNRNFVEALLTLSDCFKTIDLDLSTSINRGDSRAKALEVISRRREKSDTILSLVLDFAAQLEESLDWLEDYVNSEEFDKTQSEEEPTWDYDD